MHSTQSSLNNWFLSDKFNKSGLVNSFEYTFIFSPKDIINEDNNWIIILTKFLFASDNFSLINSNRSLRPSGNIFLFAFSIILII